MNKRFQPVPHLFNRVILGRIWCKMEEFRFGMTLGKCSKCFCMMNRGIVENQCQSFSLHEHEVDGENPETAYCRSSLRFSSKNHRFPARMPQISCTPRVLPVLQGEKRLSALAPAANHIRVGRKMTFIIQRANHRITTDGETIFFLKLSHQNFHTPHIFSPTKIARRARKIYIAPIGKCA